MTILVFTTNAHLWYIVLSTLLEWLNDVHCNSNRCEDYVLEKGNLIMLISSKVDLHVFLLLTLMVMFVYVGKEKDRQQSGQIFQTIILFLSFTIVTEGLAWFLILKENDFAGTLLNLSTGTSSLQSLAWIAYFDYKIYGDLNGMKRRLRYYLIAPIMIMCLSLANYINPGIIFEINQGTIVWKLGAFIPPILTYIMVISALIHFFKNDAMIFGRVTQTLLLFIILPVFGSIVQFFVEYVPVNWAMYTLALLMTFVMIELSELHKDELTNLSTRRHFEERLKYKLKNKEGFGLMLIDLNDFKAINDTKGHQVGDDVLKKVSQILQTSVSPEDMACRIGGDEFTLIIESDQDKVIDETKDRINQSILALESTYEDMKISLSIGCRMVADPLTWSYEALISDVDKRMYDEKIRLKQIHL